MAEFKDRLEAGLIAKGMTPAELSKKTGIGEGAISQYRKGAYKATQRNLEKISAALGVSIPWLMGIVDESQIPTIPTAPNISPMPEMKQWRVLGGTACGEPIFKELEEESVWAPVSIDADFVFRCVGDSMINARIFDGDVVFVKSCPVEDGQIGVVRIGDEYTLKRIYHGPDYLELRSENPMYKPIIVRGEQENAEIVGRAVQFLSRVV